MKPKSKSLRVKFGGGPVLTVNRKAIEANKVVYVALANKRVRYPTGTSAIVYIGSTMNGVSRIAASAAQKATALLSDHGFKQLNFYVVSCSSKKSVPTWKRLEAALLVVFRQVNGAIPKLNRQGSKLNGEAALAYFSRAKLEAAILHFIDP